MPKLDKSQYSKQEWRTIREQRRREKAFKKLQEEVALPKVEQTVKTDIPAARNFDSNTAFVLGNGTSRAPINPEDLKPWGKIYGCNALYRSFDPDYLIAVDVKMILEINNAGYQHKHEVWTNPNKAYKQMEGFNFFQPSKGWSSGPTALWLASEHRYQRIFILGFDYKGLEDGKKVNNLYAGTPNYKRTTDSATYYGNWLKQTTTTIKTHSNVHFYRVIQPDNFIPSELNKFSNLKHIYIEDFKKMFNFS
jgi:hypothetical protein